MITSLKPNQIFVFGSNEAGRHGRGAALQAFKDFGAVRGIGYGFTGQCWAFPTLRWDLSQFPPANRARTLVLCVERLYVAARVLASKEFLVTKVGCGLAGYSEDYMKRIFATCTEIKPPNVVLPEGWV